MRNISLYRILTACCVFACFSGIFFFYQHVAHRYSWASHPEKNRYIVPKDRQLALAAENVLRRIEIGSTIAPKDHFLPKKEKDIWHLQLAAFHSPENAKQLFSELKLLDYVEANKIRIDYNSSTDWLYRVYLGPYKEVSKLESIQAKLNKRFKLNSQLVEPGSAGYQ